MTTLIERVGASKGTLKAPSANRAKIGTGTLQEGTLRAKPRLQREATILSWKVDPIKRGRKKRGGGARAARGHGAKDGWGENKLSSFNPLSWMAK